MSRGLKLCITSIVLAACAPAILFSMWTKKKVSHRFSPLLRLAHSQVTARRDAWTREITLYELLVGEIPRKRRRR
jgi:hypothetical protein